MSTPSDIETLPVEVQNALGEVSSGWKLRFAKLAVKMVGATFGQEALRKAGDELDGYRGRTIVSDALAAAAARHAAQDPAMVERWMARHLDKELIGQANLEAITRQAAEEVQQANMESDSEPADDIAEDWRRRFSSFATDISDVDMQRTWARMLAGEFRAPGSFSFRTMRVLSELDSVAAQDFARFAAGRFAENAVWSPSGRYSSGPELALVTELETLGLVADRTDQVNRPVNPNKGRYFIWGHWFSGMIVVPQVSMPQLEIPIIRFTNAGLQLLKLLEQPDEATVIEGILQSVRAQFGPESVAVMGANSAPGLIGSLIVQKFLWGSEEELQRLNAIHNRPSS